MSAQAEKMLNPSTFSKSLVASNTESRTVSEVGGLPAPLHRRDAAITTFLGDIPTELLERILNHLDFLSILRCKSVCSSFRDLIDSSPYSHWKMELAVAGKEDGGCYPLDASRKMLKEHQRGWATLQWTRELRNITTGRWTLVGGVLAQTSEDESRIHFKQLPSKSRNIEERDWVVDVREFQVKQFSYDSSQDLLVVVEEPVAYAPGAYSEYPFTIEPRCRIHLWTLSSGRPHPLATENHILMRTLSYRQRQRAGLYSVQICGSTLLALFDDDSSWETDAVLWNWKTGQVLTNIVSHRRANVTFLSEKHVMFGVFLDPTVPRIVVVDFTLQPPERRRLDVMENTFTFRFPPITEAAEVVDIAIQSDPVPICKSDPASSVPFFTPVRSRLHFFSLFVISALEDEQEGEQEVNLYALGRSFLSLIEKVAGQTTASFDWPMWGPEGTRMMISSPSFQIGSSSPCGTRYVVTAQHLTDRILVYDFNQLTLRQRNNHQGSEMTPPIDAVEENTAERGGAGQPLSGTDVTEPTKISEGKIFEGEIETRLGYRSTCWVIPGVPRARFPICDEDAVVIEEEERELHIFTV